MSSGWIGVDLDGTLAYYEGWKGSNHIGEPIPKMLERVKGWLAEGRTVKIFTARVTNAGFNLDGTPHDVAETVSHIQDWCERNGLPRLEVTNVKDFGMVELWDDRAIRVHPNTGEIWGE